MRTPQQLLHSRTRVRARYALMPLEGYPTSRLPTWNKTEARILASPALGAEFVEYLMQIEVGGGTQQAADGRTETFLFLLDGAASLTTDDGAMLRLMAGGYVLIPPSMGFRLGALEPTKALVLRKVYEPVPGLGEPPLTINHQGAVRAEPFLGNEATRLQTLIPDDMIFDLAMNIFTFDPGHSLPVVETHVMEHGLYFLEGKGVYYLDDEWMEVEADDFIWMGPYVPQSFYAAGPVPSRYLYYKNVNRDVRL